MAKSFKELVPEGNVASLTEEEAEQKFVENCVKLISAGHEDLHRKDVTADADDAGDGLTHALKPEVGVLNDWILPGL